MSTLVSEGGSTQPFDASRFQKRLKNLAFDLLLNDSQLHEDVAIIEKSLPVLISTEELWTLSAESLALRTTLNPDYSALAGRLAAWAIQRLITLSFSENFQRLRENRNSKTGEPHPLVSETAVEFVKEHAKFLDSLILSNRDFDLPYFGMRTLQKLYLLHVEGAVAETPQFLFMRVAVGIHGISDRSDALERIAESYELMSSRYFIHSSPTLFNAATENNYLSLCYLMALQEDSIDGIYKSLHEAALILKGSGGIGIHVHDIRARGSLIKSSNGTSSGLVPMLRVFNSTARYVDQGGNKRPGAIAVYIEPWHGDVCEVLELRKNHGPEELRARDLFYALWIPDLFMQRVKNNEDWSLFSPSEAPGLSEVYGREFEQLYTKYEEGGRAMKTMKARKLWMHIIESQTETGMPFMLYKDSSNRKLNQKNLGTIKSSNLCCEIVEYSSKDETAVCNLGLLALPSFVVRDGDNLFFDFARLHEVTQILARNLDVVIDVTKYPVESARRSNLRHRPIAIGVQGLADTFLELRLPFESDEARKLNRQIFETIYHAAIKSSLKLAIENGPYETFPGSPLSRGQLQFDLWDHKPEFFTDWDDLKRNIKKHGLRNSLLVAPMPTASTSQILGYNECFEPFTSNLYLRRVLSGEYQVVNKYLVKDLIDLGIWSHALKDKIVMDNGLVQNIDIIPRELKDLYKTVWEISQKHVVEMAAERGCFVDQLQSMNIHLKDPTFKAFTSCHFFAWEKGLKTGMYYLRTQSASRAIQFTIDEEQIMSELASLEMPDILLLKRGKYVATRSYDSRVIREKRELKRPRREPATAEYLTDSSPESLIELLEVPESGKSTNFTSPENEDADDYDIFDETPLSCNIDDAEHCEACSG